MSDVTSAAKLGRVGCVKTAVAATVARWNTLLLQLDELSQPKMGRSTALLNVTLIGSIGNHTLTDVDAETARYETVTTTAWPPEPSWPVRNTCEQSALTCTTLSLLLSH